MIQTFMYLKLSVAGHLTLFVTLAGDHVERREQRGGLSALDQTLESTAWRTQTAP
jgi:hypothetical protein